MIDANTILNTCYVDSNVLNLAFYSHLVPVSFVLFLAFLVFFKTKNNLLSRIFLFFSVTFSLWLVGDLITWTSNNYHLIYAIWSTLVYFEVIFYILGLYFALVFVRRSDIPIWSKISLFVASLVPFYITITKSSVIEFYHPVCEAANSLFLDQYKLYLEIIILVVVLFCILLPFFKKNLNYTKKTSLMMLGSMFLFLSIFGVTEYLASVTGNYELNLYSLFVIPIFLMAITYSIFNLDIFNLKIVSTYFLVFGFLILTGIQFVFITGTTDRLLTVVTLILSIGIALLLFKNLKRESDQRTKIEKLNTELKDLIQQRESLVHLITHKVKGSFTRTKYVFAEMLNDSFGVLTPEMRKMAATGLESDDNGIKTIDMVLNASNLQNGAVKYDMKKLDLKEIVLKVIGEKSSAAELKGLKIEKEINDDVYSILGDAFWLKEVVNNFIDNSIKYTKTGTVNIGLKKENNKIIFYVKDTGVGITSEDMKNLFTEGGRGKDSVKVNVDSTGYGLFSVKLIMDAHGGRAWAESAGKDQGSTFFAELSAI